MADYPFKRILLATECSEYDAGAERIALSMAQRCGIALRVVVPIVSNPEFEVQAPELALRNEEALAQRLETLRRTAADRGVTLDLAVRHGGDPHREIVEEARSFAADLLVIRRRGKPGILASLLVGEMVSKVIRDVPCCVLTVPRAAEFWQRGVLAAVGDTPTAQDISTLSARIAAVCGLPLTIASVASEESALARIESLNTLNVSLATALCEETEGVVAAGNPAEQVIAMFERSGADLLVIGRQRYQLLPFGNKGLMQLLAGALVVPTLVVPS